MVRIKDLPVLTIPASDGMQGILAELHVSQSLPSPIRTTDALCHVKNLSCCHLESLFLLAVNTTQAPFGPSIDQPVAKEAKNVALNEGC